MESLQIIDKFCPGPLAIILNMAYILMQVKITVACRCSLEIGALKNFANFTGKQLCWSLFLIKLQG